MQGMAQQITYLITPCERVAEHRRPSFGVRLKFDGKIISQLEYFIFYKMLCFTEFEISSREWSV